MAQELFGTIDAGKYRDLRDLKTSIDARFNPYRDDAANRVLTDFYQLISTDESAHEVKKQAALAFLDNLSVGDIFEITDQRTKLPVLRATKYRTSTQKVGYSIVGGYHLNFELSNGDIPNDIVESLGVLAHGQVSVFSSQTNSSLEARFGTFLKYEEFAPTYEQEIMLAMLKPEPQNRDEILKVIARFFRNFGSSVSILLKTDEDPIYSMFHTIESGQNTVVLSDLKLKSNWSSFDTSFEKICEMFSIFALNHLKNQTPGKSVQVLI